jgi:hypothetical protein
MTPERERYEQMTAPASWWQRFKRLFVFPPLPQIDPWGEAGPALDPEGQFIPTEPPTGGSSASPAPWHPMHNSVRQLAPSLDDLHPAFAEPVIGYLSMTGYKLIRDVNDWSTTLCRDQRDINPKAGVVEVEIRVLRVIR